MSYNGEITPEQLEKIHADKDLYMDLALSTERCDRVRAEETVARAYAAADLGVPLAYVWADSPMGGAFLSHAFRTIDPDYVTEVGSKLAYDLFRS